MDHPAPFSALNDGERSSLSTLDVDGLARLLHRSRASILSDRTRAPKRVPPAHVPPGTRQPIWLLDEVLDWLRSSPSRRQASQTPRRPGRPTKAEERAWRARHA